MFREVQIKTNRSTLFITRRTSQTTKNNALIDVYVVTWRKQASRDRACIYSIGGSCLASQLPTFSSCPTLTSFGRAPSHTATSHIGDNGFWGATAIAPGFCAAAATAFSSAFFATGNGPSYSVWRPRSAQSAASSTTSPSAGFARSPAATVYFPGLWISGVSRESREGELTSIEWVSRV